MRAVNLLPPDSYAPRRSLLSAPVAVGAVLPLLAAAVVFLGWSLEHSTVVDRQDRLAAVETSIAALRPTQALRDEATRIGADRATRLTALSDALAKQLPWDVALGHLSRVVPSGVWLTSLSAQSPTPAAGTASTSTASASPTGLSIQGYTFSHDSVAQLLERLALVPGLSDVALASTGSTQIGSRPVVQFSISAALQSPTAVAPGVR